LRDEDAKKESEQCMVTLLGRTMSTSSFAMYTFSAAVLVQAVMLIGFSSFADYGMFCALVSWYPSQQSLILILKNTELEADAI
jgi:hypothetical protein